MLTHITLSGDSQQLLLTYTDGRHVALSARVLRSKAMDAESQRMRLDHGEIAFDQDIKITTIKQIGSTGINVVFSDGHKRAIYPFSYLKQLSEFSDS